MEIKSLTCEVAINLRIRIVFWEQSYLRMITNRVGKHFKKFVWTKISFDLLLIFFVYYTHNSLGKWAENIRILLNCQLDHFYTNKKVA